MNQISAVLFILFNVFCFSYGLNPCDSTFLVENNIDTYKYRDVNVTLCGCEKSKCIRKCCAAGFLISKGVCIRQTPERDFTLPVYSLTNFEKNLTSRNFMVGTLKHCDFYPIVPGGDKEFYLQAASEKLLVKTKDESFPSKYFLSIDNYCLDYDTNGDLLALECLKWKIDFVVSRQINHVGMIISMPFLLVTFLVYAILPDRNLHMKALMCYVISLLLGYIFLVMIQLSQSVFSLPGCKSVAYFCVFFFLASFFWMNVICVDIFLGFRGFRGVSGMRSTERKRFYWYNLYAWGSCWAIIIIVIVINECADPSRWFHPRVGHGQCFITDGYPQFLFFYGPMGLLITLNLVLFSLTAFKIRQVKKDTAMLKSQESKRHSYEKDKQKFNLYLKLLVAMGANWTMELVSWAVNFKTENQVPEYVWYITDFCNATYGVFIFVIFVAKRNIWRQLKRRYYGFIGKPYLAHSMAGATTKTTSFSVSTSQDNRNSNENDISLNTRDK